MALPTSYKGWIIVPVVSWLFSFFIYALAVYTTIYPTSGDKNAIDIRVSWSSLGCAVLATALVLGVRIHLDILK